MWLEGHEKCSKADQLSLEDSEKTEIISGTLLLDRACQQIWEVRDACKQAILNPDVKLQQETLEFGQIYLRHLIGKITHEIS